MGSRTTCTATFQRCTSLGTIQLESERLDFLGDFRLSIPVAEMTHVSAQNGRLKIVVDDGVAVFHLGPLADKWAARILHPRSRLNKLGIDVGTRISILAVADDEFASELNKAGIPATWGRPTRNSDVILWGVAHDHDLTRLSALTRALAPAGALWVVRPKGRAEISEASVRTAAKQAGLVDVKVVRFSATHTADKFVRPKNQR